MTKDKKELTFFKDDYGEVMRINDQVAYNYSGMVRRGILRKIVEHSYSYGNYTDAPNAEKYYNYEFHIEQIAAPPDKEGYTYGNQADETGKARLSKIKNKNSLIKL